MKIVDALSAFVKARFVSTEIFSPEGLSPVQQTLDDSIDEILHVSIAHLRAPAATPLSSHAPNYPSI